jgi:hypothetical protein
MRRLTLLALAPLLASAATAQAVLNVPADHPTIQAALDAAQPGDTVLVAPGTYHEHLQLKEDVTLSGTGWRKTIIDGGGIGDVLTADGIHNFVVENLTVRGSKAIGGNPGAGIRIKGSSTTTFGVTARVERCRILDNGDGVVLEHVHGGTFRLQKNVIDRNLRDGVVLHLGTTLLWRNTIVKNGSNGIVATAGSGFVDVCSNVIAFNGGHGLLREPTTPTNITFNDTFGNGAGAYLELVAGSPVSFTPLPGTSEIHVDPGVYAIDNGDYAPAPGSPLIDGADPALGIDVDGSTVEIGAVPYVSFYQPASKSHGSGCGPVAAWFWEPLLGQTYFESHVGQATPSAPAALLVGVSATSWKGLPLPFDLGFFGAPGCALLTGPVVMLPALTNAAGAAHVNIPIPSDPVLLGATLQQQWMVAAPGANPLGFAFSDAVASTIKI